MAQRAIDRLIHRYDGDLTGPVKVGLTKNW